MTRENVKREQKSLQMIWNNMMLLRLKKQKEKKKNNRLNKLRRKKKEKFQSCIISFVFIE